MIKKRILNQKLLSEVEEYNLHRKKMVDVCKRLYLARTKTVHVLEEILGLIENMENMPLPYEERMRIVEKNIWLFHDEIDYEKEMEIIVCGGNNKIGMYAFSREVISREVISCIDLLDMRALCTTFGKMSVGLSLLSFMIKDTEIGFVPLFMDMGWIFRENEVMLALTEVLHTTEKPMVIANPENIKAIRSAKMKLYKMSKQVHFVCKEINESQKKLADEIEQINDMGTDFRLLSNEKQQRLEMILYRTVVLSGRLHSIW